MPRRARRPASPAVTVALRAPRGLAFPCQPGVAAVPAVEPRQDQRFPGFLPSSPVLTK